MSRIRFLKVIAWHASIWAWQAQRFRSKGDDRDIAAGDLIVPQRARIAVTA